MTTTSAASDSLALMTASDLSDYLGVPTGTLANWRYQGRGPAFVRLGRHVRYRADDVFDWISGQVSDATSPRGEMPSRHRRPRPTRG